MRLVAVTQLAESCKQERAKFTQLCIMMSRMGKGPYLRDICTEREGGIVQNMMMVLIGCVNGTVQ